MLILITFWIWVTIFVYILLIGPVSLVGFFASKWLYSMMRDSEIPTHISRDWYVKMKQFLLYPWNKSGEGNEHILPILASVFGMIAWVIFIILYAVGEDFGYNQFSAYLIHVISYVATPLAEYTYWIAPIVIAVVAFNIVARRTINFLYSAKTKLDRLG